MRRTPDPVVLWLVLVSTLLVCGPAPGQSPVRHTPDAAAFTLEDRLTVASPLPVFTAWAWVTVADSSGDHTYTWTPVKRRVKALLLERIPSPYLDTLRAVYEELDPDGYHMTVLALQLTSPPAMRLDQSSARARAEAAGEEGVLEYLDAIRERSEALLPVLNAFWERADVAGVYEAVKPTYAAAVGKYKAGTIAAVRQALDYLRLPESALSSMERVVIVPSLIGMLGSAMAPTIDGVTYNVEFPTQPVDSIRFHAHEYIHYMVGDLTRGEAHREQIERITAVVWDDSAGAHARRYYPDPIQYFDENLVRMLTGATLYGGVESPRMGRSVEYQNGRGFLLVPVMAEAMRGFEAGAMPFTEYFPELLDRVEARIAPGSPGDRG